MPPEFCLCSCASLARFHIICSLCARTVSFGDVTERLHKIIPVRERIEQTFQPNEQKCTLRPLDTGEWAVLDWVWWRKNI